MNVDTGQRVRVDWLRCDGHGVCAEVAPEVFSLDDWGYPLVATGPLSGHQLGVARRAERLCPALALRLAGHGTGGSGTPPRT